MSRILSGLLLAVLALAGCSEPFVYVPEADSGAASGGETGMGSTSGSGTTSDGTDDSGGMETGSDETGSAGDTGDETGDTDGTGETGNPEPLLIGDICHPLVLDPPCEDGAVCVFSGWNGPTAEWKCRSFTGLPGKGYYGDPCEQNITNSDCRDGFECRGWQSLPEGDCEGTYCCTANCSPTTMDCEQGQECLLYSEDEQNFPPEYTDTDMPIIGVCSAQ